MISNLLKELLILKKFEYKLETLNIDIRSALNPEYTDLHQQLEERLNELGKDGWRLCGVNGSLYYFAREI